MRKRKIHSMVALSLALPLVLAACTKSGSEPSEKMADKPQTPVVLKFWKGGNDTLWHDYWVKMITEYETKNPGIKIEFADAPFGDGIDTKLNVAYASGDSPDIISHAIVSLSTRADKGQYEPLDSYIKDWTDKSDFPDYIWEAGKYKEKIYGIGHYPTPFLVAYRKDFFKEAGLDPNKPPTTWDELAQAAVKLTKRDGNQVTRAGMNLPIDDHMHLIPFGVQAGGTYVVNGLPNLDSAPFVKSLQFLTDLYKNKGVALETTFAKEGQQSLFAQGKAAISNVQPSVILQMVKDHPEMKDNIGFIQLKEQQSAIWSGMEYLFMSSESKHKKEVWDFIQYSMSKEEMWNRYKATNDPVVRKSLQDQYIKDNPVLNKAIVDNIGVGVANPKENWAPVGIKYTKQAITEAYYGKKTPEQALKDNQKLLLSEIEKMK